MFTKEQIKAAHGRVKSGSDFPRLIEEFKTLGVSSYDHVVADGANHYFDTDGNALTLEAPSAAFTGIPVADVSSLSRLKEIIVIHQRGLTDYPTFCKQAGEAGVERWVGDLNAMTVTYLDKTGQPMLVEPIPTGEYV